MDHRICAPQSYHESGAGYTTSASTEGRREGVKGESTETSKQPIRTRCLGHVTGLSANQGPVFPDPNISPTSGSVFQCIIRPSSIFTRGEVERHRLKTLIWCIWVGAAVLSVVNRLCYVKKFCGHKIDYAKLFGVMLTLTLQISIIVVSVAMVAYLSILYRRFSRNYHSEVTPLLDGSASAALLENIALTLRIVCSTLVVDLICFTYATLLNIQIIIYSVNGDVFPVLFRQLLRWLGSQLVMYNLVFELHGAVYAVLIKLTDTSKQPIRTRYLGHVTG
eukprot:sb/3467971/